MAQPERPAVTFVTCAELPDGAGERAPLTAELHRRGIESRWAVWDDQAVDWSVTPLVAVRTTWDYSLRRTDFLAWARRVEESSRLVNAAAVLSWNTHKGYLLELAAAGIGCVPTWVGRPGDAVDAAVLGSDRVVVKPAVGAGGRGLAVRPSDAIWNGTSDADEYVVQPLLTSVLTEGELSVFVLDGLPVAGVIKRAAEGEFRVHEEYGGRFRAVDIPDGVADRAGEAVATAARLSGHELPYARVDFLRDDSGEWRISEVELVEPALYPATVPDVIKVYGGVVARLVEDLVG